jgi:Tfp pilus assembly protein PilF
VAALASNKEHIMLKRSLVVISLTILLIVGATPLPAVHGLVMKDGGAMFLGTIETPQEPDVPNKGHNGVVKVLTLPFRAIGKIFGVGRKDDNKLHRLSEKDVKKFETARSLKIGDARSVPPTEATTPATPANDNGVTDQSELKPALARLNLERGRQLLDAGNLNEAIDILQVATSQDPKLKDAYNLLGIAYESKGFRDLAFKAFEKALRGGHNDPEHLNNYGYLLYKNGDYDSAAKNLKKAVKLAPNVQRYWNNLGLIEIQRERFDSAFTCFQRAVGPYEGHLNVANRLQALGYDRDAIKHLELARAIQPNSREILVRLIALYKRTGQTEQEQEARSTFVALTSVASANQ